ncbi:MAG: hypothetical protein ACM33V_14635, partial [Chloroflexota bacterium]
MRKQILKLLSILMVLSVFLSACGTATEAPQAAPATESAATKAPQSATEAPATEAPAQEELSGTISVSGAFALYPMMTVWA